MNLANQKDYYTQQDIKSFQCMLEKLSLSWATVKILADNDSNDRDAVFLKELAYAIEGCEIPIEVFARDCHIYPSYAIEKLKVARSYIDAAIRYFSSIEEEKK